MPLASTEAGLAQGVVSGSTAYLNIETLPSLCLSSAYGGFWP